MQGSQFYTNLYYVNLIPSLYDSNISKFDDIVVHDPQLFYANFLYILVFCPANNSQMKDLDKMHMARSNIVEAPDK